VVLSPRLYSRVLGVVYFLMKHIGAVYLLLLATRTCFFFLVIIVMLALVTHGVIVVWSGCSVMSYS
jgi:hypothetical protein